MIIMHTCKSWTSTLSRVYDIYFVILSLLHDVLSLSCEIYIVCTTLFCFIQSHWYLIHGSSSSIFKIKNHANRRLRITNICIYRVQKIEWQFCLSQEDKWATDTVNDTVTMTVVHLVWILKLPFSGADPGNFHESPNHFPKRSHGGGCQIYREIWNFNISNRRMGRGLLTNFTACIKDSLYNRITISYSYKHINGVSK